VGFTVRFARESVEWITTRILLRMVANLIFVALDVRSGRRTSPFFTISGILCKKIRHLGYAGASACVVSEGGGGDLSSTTHGGRRWRCRCEWRTGGL
jgi:hypothetical protein